MPSPEDRRAFLAAGLFAPVLLAGCREGDKLRAPAGPSKADLEKADAQLLVKAADLEESAIKVYKAAAGLPFIKSDALVIATAGRFMSQHAEHRDSLVKVAGQLGLGGADPSKAPMPAIPKEVLDAARPEAERKVAVLRFARKLEMQAAKAYFVFVTRQLRTDYGRKVAADILPVEAQHVAVYDLLLKGSTPAATAFFSEQV